MSNLFERLDRLRRGGAADPSDPAERQGGAEGAETGEMQAPASLEISDDDASGDRADAAPLWTRTPTHDPARDPAASGDAATLAGGGGAAGTRCSRRPIRGREACCGTRPGASCAARSRGDAARLIAAACRGRCRRRPQPHPSRRARAAGCGARRTRNAAS